VITDAVDPIANIFHRMIDTNKAVATRFTPPASYYDKVRAYAAANPDDGSWLNRGLDRDPSWWQGGWILDRLVRGEPLEVMQSSPHENQAYEIAWRFAAWMAANP